MHVRSLVRFLTAVLLACALATPAVAKPISQPLTLSRPAKVGSTQLSVGEYRMLIEDSKVTVHRNNQIVAEAQGRWEDRETKASYSSVLIDPNGQVQEIRFAGAKRVFVLSTP